MIKHLTEKSGKPLPFSNTHRNEFPTRYSLAGCSSAVPASASLAALILPSSTPLVQDIFRTVSVQVSGCLRKGRSPLTLLRHKSIYMLVASQDVRFN